jgi:hypothetical protein
MKADDEDAFEDVGGLSVSEAERILPRLERENIRFEIQTDPSPHRATDINGTPSVMLFIHRDDASCWEKIRDEFFPL